MTTVPVRPRGLALPTTLLLLVGLVLSLVPGTASAAEPTGGTATTVTVDSGPFAGLSVTVDQTRNLINQVVDVSWKGGQPTVPSTGRFGLHYLQVMQCWGDDAAGPRREQCQYGARGGDGRGGAYAPTRQVNYGDLIDPLETYRQLPGSSDNVYVPFESVTGKTSTGSRSEFFDGSTTNELAYARTRGDGAGRELFEVQTATEAPGLGCGARTAAGAVRDCYLVVVPRNEREVDGTTRSGSGANELQSSPLSASNWRHRVVIPLQFEPLGSTCPQTGERRTVGHELVSELITRWQPALCSDGGATYGFSQVADAFGRTSLAGTDPGLAFVSRPLDPATVPEDRKVVYAPVALQGLSISFLIERTPVPSAPESVQLQGGTAIEGIRLTPRLVAKLLTQSYANAVPDRNPAVEGNPELLTRDKEFLELNPEFSSLVYTQLSDAVVPVGQSDVAQQLWAWIDADPQARAWLDGTPDEHGMKVNPAYERMDLPVADYPKNDPYCRTYPDDRLPLCALERRPYAADLSEAGRSAARGDNLARQFWDPQAVPPAWRRAEPQPNGSRAVLAVTDTATAHRYGLASAALRNAAGSFVAPDTTSLLAGLATAKAGPVEGVVEPDPTTADPAAYPLTSLSYAATAPAVLSAEQGRDYAALLAYAAGPGQTPGVAPGTLPGGYVPLPEPLRAQTRAASEVVRTTAGVPLPPPADAPAEPVAPADPAAPAPTGPTSPSAPGTSSTTSSGFGDSGTSASDVAAAGGLEELLAVNADAPADEPVLAAVSTGTTPGGLLGARRFWLPALLLLGVVAGLLAPALTRMSPGRPAPS